MSAVKFPDIYCSELFETELMAKHLHLHLRSSFFPRYGADKALLRQVTPSTCRHQWFLGPPALEKFHFFFQFQLFHASFLIQIIRDANLNLSIPFHTNCLSVCLFVFQFLTDQKPLSWIFRVNKLFENCNETFSVIIPQFFTQKVGPEQIERYLRCLY